MTFSSRQWQPKEASDELLRRERPGGAQDYETLLRIFSAATAYAMRHGNFFRNEPLDGIVGLLNRLNQGNPNYRPYQGHGTIMSAAENFKNELVNEHLVPIEDRIREIWPGHEPLITLVVRTPWLEDGGIVITNDTFDAAIAEINRLKSLQRIA